MQLHFVGLKSHIHVNSSNFEYYDSWQIMRNSSKKLFSIFVPEMMMNFGVEVSSISQKLGLINDLGHGHCGSSCITPTHITFRMDHIVNNYIRPPVVRHLKSLKIQIHAGKSILFTFMPERISVDNGLRHSTLLVSYSQKICSFFCFCLRRMKHIFDRIYCVSTFSSLFYCAFNNVEMMRWIRRYRLHFTRDMCMPSLSSRIFVNFCFWSFSHDHFSAIKTLPSRCVEWVTSNKANRSDSKALRMKLFVIIALSVAFVGSIDIAYGGILTNVEKPLPAAVFLEVARHRT